MGGRSGGRRDICAAALGRSKSRSGRACERVRAGSRRDRRPPLHFSCRIVPAGGVSAACVLSSTPGELFPGMVMNSAVAAAAASAATASATCLWALPDPTHSTASLLVLMIDGACGRPSLSLAEGLGAPAGARLIDLLLFEVADWVTHRLLHLEAALASRPGRGSRACGRRSLNSGARLRSRHSRAPRRGGP